ncbi:hypothetical protein J1605_006184 [Eschrichtius robustus]|uniref:Uncharacterized protein n=1 Tax=Eschrichtius robustus TaxID=9764 RepID=A0AB34H6Z2_ESCRO|nr:hypothetical protein J1605_006184 [Eschrichtius robustus]
MAEGDNRSTNLLVSPSSSSRGNRAGPPDFGALRPRSYHPSRARPSSPFPGAGDDACPLGFLGNLCLAVTSRVDSYHSLGKVHDGARRARDHSPRIGVEEEAGEGGL